MQNLKKFHRQIFKQTQDISILWSYFETQLRCHGNKFLKVPLRRKFIGLFPPNSVAEYRVLFIFPQKTKQQTFNPNIF